MKCAFAIAIIISLGGCALFQTERTVINVRPPVYSADEIDAMNARSRCRQLARNPVEVARCDGS